MQHLPNDLRKIIENEKDVALYLSSISAQDFIKDIQSILTKSEILQKLPKRSVEDRRLDFIAALTPYVQIYGRDMVNEFYKYWIELNPAKTRMKFEKESTWELKLRIERWANNSINKKKAPEQLTIHLKETPRN